MKWSSKVSEQFNTKDAIDECVAHIKADLGGEAPDLAVMFASAHHSPDFDDMPALLGERLGASVLVGCSGGGVIGGGKEVEDRTGFALTAATLPGVTVQPFHVQDGDLPSLDADPGAWERLVHSEGERQTDFVMMSDPFTLRTDDLIAGLDYAFPGRVKVGGLASGSNSAGGNALFLNGQVHRSGAVGVALRGALQVKTVVAQGCRPIGEPAVITQCKQNMMLEIEGRKPLEVLQEMFNAADERDRGLINRALHVGIVMDPLMEEFRPGDFLMRNVMGIQQETGGIAVGEMLREGQVIQFHVRDGKAAEEDLQALLRQYTSEREGSRGEGALLFSCLGRGQHMFGRPDHDTDIFRDEVGALPLGGFFCNGEIGPVGPNTFLHGFTSSFAIFSPK